MAIMSLHEDPIFGLKPVEFKLKVKSDEIEAFICKREHSLTRLGLPVSISPYLEPAPTFS